MVGGVERMTELNDAQVGHDMNYLEAADRIHSDYPECQDQLVSESRPPVGLRPPSCPFGDSRRFHTSLHLSLLCNS